MKKVSHPVEPRICYRKANPLYLANNQIQAKYIELGDKAFLSHLCPFPLTSILRNYKNQGIKKGLPYF
jgi:hypothetical protein